MPAAALAAGGGGEARGCPGPAGRGREGLRIRPGGGVPPNARRAHGVGARPGMGAGAAPTHVKLFLASCEAGMELGSKGVQEERRRTFPLTINSETRVGARGKGTSPHAQ